MTHAKLDVYDCVDALNESLVEAFIALTQAAIAARGVCRVSLSGGSTPKRLYQSLAGQLLDWERIQWYWGDERNVPHDHADSNFKMVNEAMLIPAKVPPSQFFPVMVDASNPASAATQYEATLKQMFHGAVTWPQWDLVLLGMGDDAHTASLFPGTLALKETERWFVENWVEKFDSYRYTLTAPAINSGREIWFLITGANKREPLGQVLGDEHNPDMLPSQLIKPTRYFLTRDAYDAAPLST